MIGLALPSLLVVAGTFAASGREYVPLAKGNEWVLSGPNNLNMTIRVTGSAKVGAVRCMVVESLVGKQLTKDYLAVADDAVRCYRSEAGGQIVQPDPPLVRMKLPYQTGQTWSDKLSQGGTIYLTDYRATGLETVKVPAGEFKCITIASTMTGPQGKMLTRTWYGRGIGPVKQTVSVGKLNMNFELVRTNVRRASVKTGTTSQPTARRCPKCKSDQPASFKYCPKCGTATVAKVKARPTPKPKPKPKPKPIPRPKPTPAGPLKRYESPDGKAVLYHPAGWTVQQGAMFGKGGYAVMVQNPERSAAMMFMTLPLGSEVKDSVALAQAHLSSLRQANRAVQVMRMTSAKDRSRTRTQVTLTTKEGADMRAHVHYFHTPRVGTMFCMMARQDRWQASLPTLTRIVANLAYSPEGVKNVQKKAREMASSDRRVAATGGRALSPMAMLASAEGRRGRALRLTQISASDGSFTIQIPQGWQYQAMALQYWTSPNWQRKTHGVSFVSKEMLSPRATSIRVPGVIRSDYVPPPQALALVMADGQVGKNVRILAETAAARIVPEVSQYLRMLEGRGLRGDIRLMHVKFTSPSTGQICRGLFSVSCFVSPLGIAWSCLVEGGWAPDQEFDDYLPLYWRIVKSHRYNERYVGQRIAQQAARQRQLNQSLQRALAESRQAFQDLQGSFRQNSRTRDYTSWLFSQTTLGQGTWVSQAEGGTLHQTDRWGLQRETGDRVDLPPYNNTNFTGRSPWTGEQLQEVNTLPEWQRCIQGQR